MSFAVGDHVVSGRPDIVEEVVGRDGERWQLKSLYLGASCVTDITVDSVDDYRAATPADHEQARKYADWFNGGEIPYWQERKVSGLDYSNFVTQKMHAGADEGFEPLSLPGEMFGFQAELATWALRRGRAAIFADCGLGKTLIQLAWADNVVRKTNRHVLLLTPLAVTHQTIAEAAKFSIEAFRSGAGELPQSATIVVTNYERLHYFNPDDFVGVICDESSILKSFEGATRAAITNFMRKVQYRLLCTATAAPNDFVELGTSSEALGYLGHTDMLGRFFKSDSDSIRPFAFGLRGQFNQGSRWRLKGHAELPFWRWVCSWARAVRRPSDLGFEDGDFVLPPLNETEHLVSEAGPAPGQLFSLAAIGLQEQRAERKRTIVERCEKVAELVNHTGKPALTWCHLNVEGDKLASLIPDSAQVSGKDSDEAKEAAFRGFIDGSIRVLVTKPSIGAWGLNFQHCSHVTFFPSHSFEQHYQGIRRCWRFGQKQPVQADVVTSAGEAGVLANLQRKAAMADTLFANLVAEMSRGLAVINKTNFNAKTEVPSWL